MPDSSKDCTPEKTKTIFDDDDFEDETLAERLWGLTEMFPDGVRNATHTLYCGTKTGVKGLVSLVKQSSWLFFSSSAILFAPVIFEIERARIEEEQRSQQKQVLLGPSSAMAGSLR